MTRFFTLTLLSIFLTSCFSARVNYLGSSYGPTKDVDVYVDASAIKKNYTIMGKGFVDPSIYGRMTTERMQENVIEKAKEKGADAVLFQDIFLMNDGTNISSVARTDSIGKASVTVRNATIGPVISSRRDILFLKYDK